MRYIPTDKHGTALKLGDRVKITNNQNETIEANIIADKRGRLTVDYLSSWPFEYLSYGIIGRGLDWVEEVGFDIEVIPLEINR